MMRFENILREFPDLEVTDAAAIDVLRSAQGYIQRKGQVKPGWTDADHDAYWMLRKREEQILRDAGIEFYAMVTGPLAENIS